MADNKLDKLGYVIKDPKYKTKSDSVISPVEPEDEFFSARISNGGYFGYYLEQGTGKQDEFHLIRIYRDMALLPEVDSAVDDVVNEAITSDSDEPPVLIDLSKLPAKDTLKNKIREEFDYILSLMDFDDKCHQIFRRWYVDGRLFFHKIIDLEKPKEGIKELRYIDPLKIKKVRVKKEQKPEEKRNSLDFGEIEEFFVYKPSGFLNQHATISKTGKTIKLSKDAVTFVPSGAIDYNNNNVVSYLHKAIKASNQLQMIEDSIVIYRLCLAEYSRVATPFGYKYIQDITPGDIVYCYDNRKKGLVTTKVTNQWMTGVKDTYTVSSEHHSITGTDTHPILVRDLSTNEVKYVPIKDIVPEKQCFVYECPRKTELKQPLDTYKTLNTPEYLNEDLALLLGLFSGENCQVEDDRILVYIDKYGSRGEIYTSLIEKTFPDYSIISDPLDNYDLYVFKNEDLKSLLDYLNLKGYSEEQRVPSWLYTSPLGVKLNYVYGLTDKFGDRDHIDGYSIEYTHPSITFLEDLKEIWTSIGMTSSVITYVDWAKTYSIKFGFDPLPKFERIKSVTKSDSSRVYDIEVEHEKHNFVANGIIVHNSRAPERRIFYVDVGNLPTPKASQYMKEIMNRYRTKIQYDAKTGYIRDGKKHMSMLEDFFIPRKDGCFSLDTRIKLLDGRDVELGQLIVEHKEGKQNWTYSVAPDGSIVPGLISWAGVTRNNAEVVKVTLDNGEEIISTPDHKFILRNGKRIQAKDLTEGDSLMPLDIINEKLIRGSKQNPYFKVKSNKTNKHQAVHRIIHEFFNEPQASNEVIHHVDFDRYNNNPDNLVVMDKKEHIALHGKSSRCAWENGNYELHCKRFSESGKKFFQTEEGLKRRKEISEFNKNSEKIWNALKNARKRMLELKQLEKTTMSKEEYHAKWYKSKDIIQKINQENKIENVYDIKLIKDIIEENFHRKLCSSDVAKLLKPLYPNVGKYSINRIFKTFENMSFSAYMSKTYKEKWKWYKRDEIGKTPTISDVAKIIDEHYHSEITSDEILTILKKELSDFNYNVLSDFFKEHGYENYSDFMTRTYGKDWGRWGTKYLETTNHKVVSVEFLDETMDVGTLTIDENHIHHDYHNFGLSAGVFVMNSKGTEITTLDGGQNLSELEDIKYFQKKLYQALNIPPSRLESDNTFNIGRGSEISRDELKFAKFIGRLRKQFSHLFLDILKSQLILKNIINVEDWAKIKEFIQFDYIFDNHFNELKNIEILNERLNAVSSLDAYVGKYFSHKYILSKILKMSDKEIEEIQKDIKIEKENNLYLTKEEEEAEEQKQMEATQQQQAAQGGEPSGDGAEAPPEGGEMPPEEGMPQGEGMAPGGDINTRFRQLFGKG